MQGRSTVLPQQHALHEIIGFIIISEQKGADAEEMTCANVMRFTLRLKPFTQTPLTTLRTYIYE